MASVREPAVAGTFYPAHPRELERAVAALLETAPKVELPAPPRALIVPHAGYAFSGPVAATAFRAVAPYLPGVRRVVLIGPTHYVPFAGLVLAPHAAFRTPLGLVRVDTETGEDLLELRQVGVHARPHAPEHALEVELPFLQVLGGAFRIVPLLFGGTDDTETVEVLERAWPADDPGTLLIVSSDLSHDEPYGTAKAHDAATAAAIEGLDPRGIGPAEACGYRAIRALVHLARERGLVPVRLALASSGDTAGPRDSVVGYGAWAFC